MTATIIDTNVLVVADRRHAGAGIDCEAACADVLEAVIRGEDQLVLDDGDRIFFEYRNNQGPGTQQPGVGARFWIWLLQNRYNTEFCELVAITVLADSEDGNDFEEFPEDPDLDGFDPDDRKFVATARASQLGPRIMEASDAGWWPFRLALARNEVEVLFLCPALMGA